MDLLIRIDRAQARQDFRMCVPPEPDDTDIVLRDCKEEIASLRQQLAAAKFREESLINTAKVNREGLQEQLAAALAACEAKDARFKQIVRMANHLDVLSIAMQAHDALATKPDASALKAHDEALIERIAFMFDESPNAEMFHQDIAEEIRKLKDQP